MPGGLSTPALSEEQKALAERVRYGALTWSSAEAFMKEYHLTLGDRIYGEMANSTRPGFDAWGECLGESWEFRLERTFYGRVDVTMVSSDTDREGAHYRGWHMGSGTIRLPERDMPLDWARPFFKPYTHYVRTLDRVEIVRLQPHFLRGARRQTAVTVPAPAWDLPALPRLLLLGWFLQLHFESTRGRVFRRVKDQD